jgi:hypothetical protein
VLHTDTCLVRQEWRWYCACCDIASAIGHADGSLYHILEAGAKDLVADLSVEQLHLNEGCLVSTHDSAVCPGNSDGLCLDPGVAPNKLAHVELDSVLVGGYLGGVLVVDKAQFEGVPCTDARLCKVSQ